MTTASLQELFFKEIPITRSMGLTVSFISDQKIEIVFKLAENKNHKNTAFGGSQYTACALACYGLFLVGIREHGFLTNNIVISDGRIKYKQPVTTDFKVSADWDISLKNSFFQTLTKKRKAKVTLKSQVFAGNTLCAEFDGDFVAKLHN